MTRIQRRPQHVRGWDDGTGHSRPGFNFSIHQVVAATHNTVKAVSPSGEIGALWSEAAEFRTESRRITPLDQP